MKHYVQTNLTTIEDAVNLLADREARERWGRGFYSPRVLEETDGTYTASWQTGDSCD